MIELTELKLVTASNIINERTKAGMTQAELGAKLNYSDKSVSKWERGEAIPDAYVLSEMAELFGVTVDYLLSSHDGWEPPKEEKPEEEAPKYSVDIIIAIAILGIWTMSLTAFVVLWLMGTLWWPVFAVALTVSLLTYMVLLCVFKRTKYLQFVIAAFVLSVFFLLYVLLPQKPWQLFLIAIPALIIVFLSCNIRINPARCRDCTEKKNDSTIGRDGERKRSLRSPSFWRYDAIK